VSVPAYPEYKDSGVPWLGDVPRHWDKRPLFALVCHLDDSNIGMKENNLLSLSYGQIKRKNIEDNDGLLPASFETYQIVERDDIIWRLTDLQNDQRSLRTGIVRERGIITSAYLATRPLAISPAFLSYLLRGYDLTKVFYSMGGGLRQSMKYADVKWLPIMVPTTEEQATIVTFLDQETAKIDGLVAEQRRLIALLKEKRQAVISHAVTKGLNPNAPLKDSGNEWLGQIPSHWEVRKLRDLTTRIGDGLHGTPEYNDYGEYHFINGNNLSNGKIEITDTTRSVSVHTANSNQVDIGENTVLMSINGTIGNLALYRDEKVILGKSAAYINCNENLDRRFLFFSLQADPAKEFFRSTLANTTIHNLSLEAIRSLRSGIPPLPEQSEIAGALDEELAAFDGTIGMSELVVSLLQERRAALISSAVTGKIDVRTAVSAPELETA
jgi:type I restriction enzyme S subunit